MAESELERLRARVGAIAGEMRLIAKTRRAVHGERDVHAGALMAWVKNLEDALAASDGSTQA